MLISLVISVHVISVYMKDKATVYHYNYCILGTAAATGKGETS